MNTTTTDRLTVKVGTTPDGSAVTIPVERGVVVGGRPGSGKTHLVNLIASRVSAAAVTHIDGKYADKTTTVEMIDAVADRARQGITGEVLIIEEIDGDTRVSDALERLARARGAFVIISQRPSQLPYAVLDTAVSKIALGRLDERDAYALFGDADVPTPEDRRTALVNDGSTTRLVTAVTIA